MSAGEARRPYEVRLSDEAVYALAEVTSDRIFERIGSLMESLGEFPRLGEVYDPYYEATVPPVTWRVLFCGPYGIYYHVDDEASVVTIVAIEDVRRDPRMRFSANRGLHGRD